MRKEKVCEECKKPWVPKEHSGSEAWGNRKYCCQECCRRNHKRRMFKRGQKP